MMQDTLPSRRRFLQTGLIAATLLSLPSGCRRLKTAKPRIVIVGGGVGGTTVARYLQEWSTERLLDIKLVTPHKAHFMCPSSNLFIAGLANTYRMGSHTELQQRGIQIVYDRVDRIDRDKKQVRLTSGKTLSYDWLILSPGVAFQEDPLTSSATIAAWGDEKEAVTLAAQVQALRDDDTVVITIPLSPYKCPAAPYERACLIARHIQRNQLDAQVVLLDENPDIVSKARLFHSIFENRYADIISYQSEMSNLEIDPLQKIVSTPFDDISATIINRIPPQQSHPLLANCGLIPAGDLWCPIDWMTMQSLADPNIYVLGDSATAASQLPKSAHVANNQAKICAAAVIRAIHNEPAFIEPMAMNCCFSHVTEDTAIHIASVSRYDYYEKEMKPIQSSFSLSDKESQLESFYAREWLDSIMEDIGFDPVSENRL